MNTLPQTLVVVRDLVALRISVSLLHRDTGRVMVGGIGIMDLLGKCENFKGQMTMLIEVRAMNFVCLLLSCVVLTMDTHRFFSVCPTGDYC